MLLNRRATILGSLACLGACALGCASSPYSVTAPRSVPLGDAVLSLQVTARPSIIKFISPRGRYRDKLRPHLQNRLIQEGFVIKPQAADLHLHVQLHEITTGSSARQVRCDLLVELYEAWPGDLTKKNAHPPQHIKPVFSMLVSETVHQRSNGYDRELLAREAAERCVEDVVRYLVRARTHALD
jgi:hypothetical protein